MKRILNYLMFGLFLFFSVLIPVHAEETEFPFYADASTKTLILKEDKTLNKFTLGESSWYDGGSFYFSEYGDYNVLDLNGNTLTLNGTFTINQGYIIKNGIIKRSETHKSGSLVVVDALDVRQVVLQNVVLDGCEIVMTSNTPTGAAFGLYVTAGDEIVLDNVIVKNNYTGINVGAAGIYLQEVKSAIIRDCEIFNNKSTWNSSAGAAIYAQGGKNIEIINTKIYSNNSATNGVVTINSVDNFIFDKNSSISNNISTVAAGLYLFNSNATISGTIESNKSTSNNGGGLYTIFMNGNQSNKVIKITDTAKIVNNESACAGGGLYVNADKSVVPGKVIIDGALFSGNKSLGTVDESDGLYKNVGGGAIAVARGILEINDVMLNGNSAAINKGNSIMVSHANGNLNGGKLTINGGKYDDSIDLGVGSIVVNGGIFKYNMEKYIANTKLISKKTDFGYEIVKNNVLTGNNITFENEEAMENSYKLNVIEKIDLLKNEKINQNIKNVILDVDDKANNVKVLALYDISVTDGMNEVEMKNGKFRISINLDENLLKYNSYVAVYIDDNGSVSYLPVELDGTKATFEVEHLSTYGIVGYNNIVNPETNVNLEYIIIFVLVILMSISIGVNLKKIKK